MSSSGAPLISGTEIVKEPPETAEGEAPGSMNQWPLDAMAYWVKFQRQHFALLSVAMAMDQATVGSSE